MQLQLDRRSSWILGRVESAQRRDTYPFFNTSKDWDTDLGTCDYLGLSKDERIIESAISCLRSTGFGGTSSRLHSGTSPYHEELEAELACFLGYEAALTLNSGYSANVAVISVLLELGYSVAIERESHASVFDGLANRRPYLFRRNDPESLAKALAKAPKPRAAVLEGLHSVHGDVPDLSRLIPTGREFAAVTVLDDAHGIGGLGTTGKGVLEHFPGTPPDILTGTFSKAFGCSGGFVCSTSRFGTVLRHTARNFIFTAATPPHLAAAAQTAARIVRSSSDRRETLWRLSRVLHGDSGRDPTPIRVFRYETLDETIAAWLRLRAQRVGCNCLLPPAVKKGHYAIRLSVTSLCKPSSLELALAELREGSICAQHS